MPEAQGNYSNRWLSVFSLNPKKTAIQPKVLINTLFASNIEVRHVWKPMHQQPVFKDCQYFSESHVSYCDYLFETGVCLPSSSNMSVSQQNIVIQAIVNIFL